MSEAEHGPDTPREDVADREAAERVLAAVPAGHLDPGPVAGFTLLA